MTPKSKIAVKNGFSKGTLLAYFPGEECYRRTYGSMVEVSNKRRRIGISSNKPPATEKKKKKKKKKEVQCKY